MLGKDVLEYRREVYPMHDRQSRTPKMPRGKWYRIMLVISVLGVVALFSAGTLSHPLIAHAGTKGQQLQLINCNPTTTHVRIEGPNQDGNDAVWEKDFNPPQSTVTTSGWWWDSTDYPTGGPFGNGDVRIDVTASTGGVYTNAVSVPGQYPSDVYQVQCYNTIVPPSQ
jgi:hypothetical protein